MYRKFLALFISIALTLAGIQPGVASMIGLAMSMPASMDHMDMGDTSMDHMGMDHRGMPGGSDMEAMDHSCCPDHDPQAPCDGNCAMSWLACAIHCGIAATVFTTAAEIMFRYPSPSVDRTPTHPSSLSSIDDSPPFHPPKLFIRV